MFLTPGKNPFCFPSSKICFRNTCLPRGQSGKHLHPQECFLVNSQAFRESIRKACPPLAWDRRTGQMLELTIAVDCDLPKFFVYVVAFDENGV